MEKEFKFENMPSLEEYKDSHDEETKIKANPEMRISTSTVETDLSFGPELEASITMSSFCCSKECLNHIFPQYFSEEDIRAWVESDELHVEWLHEPDPKLDLTPILKLDKKSDSRSLLLPGPLKLPSLSMTSRGTSSLLRKRGKELPDISVSPSTAETQPTDTIFSKYEILKENFKGRGSSASVYELRSN